ncbi:hypothetical protein BDR05DRAFT_898537 [Suillus weaverae]|nr:hypothetical protein BDR05DRAFT_898537 [Suillus weaverae]
MYQLLKDQAESSCDKPHKCAKLAKDILECILPKWHPQTSAPSYVLNIAPEQITDVTDDQNKQNKIFNPIYPSPDSLSEGYRVFVSSDAPCSTPACQAPTPPGEPPQLTTITIAGTHRIDKDGFHISGGGAWFGMNDH